MLLVFANKQVMTAVYSRLAAASFSGALVPILLLCFLNVLSGCPDICGLS